jgi:hypothetical protein
MSPPETHTAAPVRLTVSKKTCPSCGAEVPSAASRCKHCFHDFGAGEDAPRKTSGVIILLVLIVALLGAGFGIATYAQKNIFVKQNIVIDQETESVIWTRTTTDGMSTERLPFSEIKELEFVIGGKKATWVVYAVKNDGEKKLLHQSNEGTLEGYADHLSHVMKKDLVEVRNMKNFDEQYTLDD